MTEAAAPESTRTSMGLHPRYSLRGFDSEHNGASLASDSVSATSRDAAARKDFPAGSKTWMLLAPAKGKTFRRAMLGPMTYSGQSW